MEKISIYDAHWSSFGGGEKYVCTLAELLSATQEYDVTLLIDGPSVTRDVLSQYFHLNLQRVKILDIARRDVVHHLAHADIGLVVSNFRTFGTRAKKNVYVLQIPYVGLGPSHIARQALRGEFTEAAKDFLRRQLLRDAGRSNLAVVYSNFVRDALHRYHGIDARVLYPPIDDFKREGKKEHVILSVGRFFSGLYNDKRYDVLIRGFKRMRERFPNISWEYRLVGSCGTDAASQRYLTALREMAQGDPIYFYVNLPYEELRTHYNEATLFWHATGFDVDEVAHPDRMEHFGMSTVEAMSAECVPVVIDKGGQKEIVSHGESGYLWHTIDELIEYSMRLMTDRDLLARMQTQTRERFKQFDRQHFSDRVVSLFHTLS